MNVLPPRKVRPGLLNGYRARVATTATPISRFTLKSDPMGSQKNRQSARIFVMRDYLPRHVVDRYREAVSLSSRVRLNQPEVTSSVDLE